MSAPASRPTNQSQQPPEPAQVPETGIVALIGPPGAGKTTVGRQLARELNLPLIDTDKVIEQEAGKAVAQIFVEDGEPAFRALEKAVAARVLAGPAAVVSLGGGAPMDSETQEHLAGCITVFLDVSAGTAYKRVGLNQARPLLLGNPRAQWRALMAARRPVYEQLANVRVETDERSPADIARQIANLIAARLKGANGG
jgi:shikimate kinase